MKVDFLCFPILFDPTFRFILPFPTCYLCVSIMSLLVMFMVHQIEWSSDDSLYHLGALEKIT